LTDHVIYDIPLDRKVGTVGNWAVHQSVKILFNEHKRGFEIGVVVFVRNTPTERTELSSFLDDGMHEADSIDQGSPVSMFNLIHKVLVDDGCESLVKTSLDTLGRFIGDLDTFLQETEREFIGRFASNEETEIRVHVGVFLDQEAIQILHELKTQMAVLENSPGTSDHTVLDTFISILILSFTHGDFITVNLSLLLGEFID
jgi:hypothetical protein